MSESEQTVLMIRGAIASLPPEQQERCNSIADQIRILSKEAGDVGMLALALIGAEVQLANEQAEQG